MVSRSFAAEALSISSAYFKVACANTPCVCFHGMETKQTAQPGQKYQHEIPTGSLVGACDGAYCTVGIIIMAFVGPHLLRLS